MKEARHETQPVLAFHSYVSRLKAKQWLPGPESWRKFDFEGTEVGKRRGGAGDRIESSKTCAGSTATQLPKITKPGAMRAHARL